MRRDGIAALRDAVTDAAVLERRLGLDAGQLAKVARHYRLRIPRDYLELIEEADDPIARQAVPRAAELNADGLSEDTFAEDLPRLSPVPHLTHRYPDRVLLLEIQDNDNRRNRVSAAEGCQCKVQR